MKKIIEATMQRAILALICILLILAWGGISAYQMQRDYLPSINNNTLMVTLRASNYKASQVKQAITDKLQSALRTADGLQDVETNSYDGGLTMNLSFPMNFDMAKAENEVNQALTSVDLPEDVQKPTVTRLTTSSFPILTYSITSNSPEIDENTLRSTVQSDIVKQIGGLPGVADVRVTGGANQGYKLIVHMKDLEKYGLTLDNVNQALAKNASILPSGNISNGQLSIPVTVDGWKLSDQDLKNIQVTNDKGVNIPLTKIADLTHSLTDVKTITRTNGQPSVLIDVLKTPSANITDVADRVKARVQQIPSIKNGDVNLSVLLDRENDLNSSLHGLVREGLLGALFSMLCVFFFFRNVRSTLLIAVSLPISLLATTAILKAMGITLNILTVSGLIVAMGRIVDDSIVILDNMYRSVQEGKGKGKLHLLASGAYEMIPAILASTLTTIAVYVPIAMVGGIVSASFSGFAWSVVVALVISFFVAALVIPTFGYLGWKSLKDNSKNIEPVMEPVLRFAFKRKRLIVSLSVVIFLAAASYAATLPVNILPSSSSSSGASGVAIKLELPTGSPLSQVDAEVKKVEKVLSTNPNVSAYSSNYGSTGTPQSDDVFDEGGGYITPPNVANVSVSLKNKDSLPTVISQLQSQLPKLSKTVAYTVTDKSISGDDNQLKVMLTGADQQTLTTAAQIVRNKLLSIPGLTVAGQADTQKGLQKYRITLNRGKIDQAGVKLDDILKVLNRYLTRTKDFSFTLDNHTIPGDMQLDQLQPLTRTRGTVTAKNVLDSLAAETIPAKNGKVIELGKLIDISKDQTGSSIQEHDGQPDTNVTATITSNDLSKVSDQVQQTLDGLTLPKGVSCSLGGISGQVTQMILDMSMALSFSILLVLLIISSVFKGWRAPVAILVSIPLALSGVVVAMFLSHAEWNLAALIGVLMLTGIVVTNAIVMIDKIERNIANGMEMREGILRGSLSRVRPIFMTAGTTILTLIPLALSHGSDTVISQTLGIVVIGGMITSTLNSFLVIPIIYEWLNKKRVKVSVNEASQRNAV